MQFTDKGIQDAKQTTQRVAAWAAKVQSMGVTIKQMYWTLGQYDQVCIFEAPDDETAASVLLAGDMLGNIRAQTMRAFTASEMEKILAKVPSRRHDQRPALSNSVIETQEHVGDFKAVRGYCAFILLPGTSGRKWRIRPPHIRAKPTRGAMNAINMAVVKIARTTIDRRLAM